MHMHGSTRRSHSKLPFLTLPKLSLKAINAAIMSREAKAFTAVEEAFIVVTVDSSRPAHETDFNFSLIPPALSIKE
jgi:hypothetical protein